MSREVKVDDSHVRVVSDDGSSSRVYDTSDNWRCVEVADHHSNGTTEAFEYSGNPLSALFNGSRGEPK